MTANTVLSKITPLVSTPEVCLLTLQDTKMPREQQTLRAPIRTSPFPHHHAYRYTVMPGHLRSIQYP